VGTNLGVTLINVRTREIVTALSFNHIFNKVCGDAANQPTPAQSSFSSFTSSYRGSSDRNSNHHDDPINGGIFASMISQLILGVVQVQDPSAESAKQGCLASDQRENQEQTILIMAREPQMVKPLP